MKNTIRTAIAILAASLIVAGCASNETPAPKFSADTVNAMKTGMAKSDVVAMLGEPRSRSADTDGTEIWQYRKNAQQGKGAKMFADVMSFGITSDTDAEYQDILTVAFKGGNVSKVTYEENVHLGSGLTGHN